MTLVTLAGVACVAQVGSGQPGAQPMVIDEAVYVDRLRAMWMAQCVANWTGLKTEACRQQAPFLTDADWNTSVCNGFLDFNTASNPWGADDDTDIEYVYLHALANASRPDGVVATTLSPVEIRDAWVAHINRSIWVSNARARALFDRGMLPPTTSVGTANRDRLMIDAQLTTEFFGAFAPGAPAKALEMADLPIATTAAGYAAHASQFYAVLYALGPMVPEELSGRDKVLWFVERARTAIPDESKSADIVDFCVADYLANPDVDDWERTRDLVAQRYQVNPAAEGFVYRTWYESSVNFAGGVIALLYGEADLSRTIQIGTMSGWDSDNGTATMGGLVGLMIGTEAVRGEFPGRTLSDNYWITRTRDNLPDYVPGAGNTEDTFTLMAHRMLPIVRQAIIEAGGVVDDAAPMGQGRIVTPPFPRDGILMHNPRDHADARSWNNVRIRAGAAPVMTTNLVGGANPGRGSTNPNVACNGIETSWLGLEEIDAQATYFTSTYAPNGATTPLVLTLAYAEPITTHALRFIEGDHFRDFQWGGWATSIAVEAEVAPGQWHAAAVTLSEALNDQVPFQIIDLEFEEPITATAFRITMGQGGGVAGGGTGTPFVNVSEIDALRSDADVASRIGVRPTYDLDGNESITVDDLAVFERALAQVGGGQGVEVLPAGDLNADAALDGADRAALLAVVRFREATRMGQGRP
jgi:hypothetical protein